MTQADKIIEQLRATGFYEPKRLPPRMMWPHARRLVEAGMRRFIGEGFVWQAAYDELVEWVSDTAHRGLFLMGPCGRGKTVFAKYVLPVLMKWRFNLLLSTYDATYLMTHADEVIARPLVMIDDIGTEAITIVYGQRRVAFAELVDRAEKEGKLLVITTNLTPTELTQKYGERTLSRLAVLTRCITFKGEDMRRRQK